MAINNKIEILTFDIEEWFHLLDHNSTKTSQEWANYEVRIHQNMERILTLLKNTNQKATFFCLGWIARQYPEVIKAIISHGHEIGCHSHLHQLVYEQTPAEFEADLKSALHTLEDISGEKIRMYRAPGFSITEKNKWAFEILAKNGIEIDCSVFPANRAHGGFASFQYAKPSIIRYNGIELKELPINYHTLFGTPIIFSGGGYFRLLPYALIKKWSAQSNYVMTYFHPRDFDAAQPLIKDLPLSRKFKSYVGLKGATPKFEQWLSDFEFIDIGTAVNKIDWSKVPIVDI